MGSVASNLSLTLSRFHESLLFSHRWVWFSRPASTLVSFTSSTTSTTVTTCPACPSAPWSRAPTRWTASYPGPPRRRSSLSSWWSRPPSASWCASARWSTSSASASTNSWRGRTRQRGSCLPRAMRWRLWLRRGQSWGPNHRSGWIQQPRSLTSAPPPKRSDHSRNKWLQHSRRHAGATEQTLKDVFIGLCQKLPPKLLEM